MFAMIMDIPLDKLLECASLAAREAGLHALQNASKHKKVYKSFQHDIKLTLDLECQSKAIEIIRSHFPHHSILGEESWEHSQNRDAHDMGYEWIIDPIDGTVNYFHGLHNWCCSVAVRKSNKILAGVVFIPAANETFTATIKEPAKVNGDCITVSPTDDLKSSLILTGLDKNDTACTDSFEIFRSISVHTRKTRIMGSAASDICQVACGRAEGYYEAGIYIWDIAAAGLILQRAGGQIEILRKQDDGSLSFLATNGKIHNGMRQLIPVD